MRTTFFNIWPKFFFFIRKQIIQGIFFQLYIKPIDDTDLSKIRSVYDQSNPHQRFTGWQSISYIWWCFWTSRRHSSFLVAWTSSLSLKISCSRSAAVCPASLHIWIFVFNYVVSLFFQPKVLRSILGRKQNACPSMFIAFNLCVHSCVVCVICRLLTPNSVQMLLRSFYIVLFRNNDKKEVYMFVHLQLISSLNISNLWLVVSVSAELVDTGRLTLIKKTNCLF